MGHSVDREARSVGKDSYDGGRGVVRNTLGIRWVAAYLRFPVRVVVP